MFNPEKLPPGRLIFPTPTYFSESQFFGRTTDVDCVKQILDMGSSVAISGKRRIGRSWFLQHLHSALSQEQYLIVDSDELKPDTIVPRKTRLFLSALIFTLEATLREYLPDNHSCKLLDFGDPPTNVGQAFWSDLTKLRNYLEKADLTAVVLLDEAEALYQFTDETGIVPAVVRSLATDNAHIRVIVAGFDLRSPLGNHPPLFDAFVHHQLYGIGSEGAHDLIIGQFEPFGITFETPEIWSNVLELTGGEPVLLRLLGQQLVEQARHSGGIIGALQIRDAVEDFFNMTEVKSMLNYAWAFLGENKPIHTLITALGYNVGLDTSKQDEFIAEIRSQFYQEHPPEAVVSDLDRLCALGFLNQDENTSGFHFSSGLLRRWICRHRPDPGIHL